MTSLYLWLKVVHVLAVTVWLGAAVAILGIIIRLSQPTDRPSRQVMASICDVIGGRMVAPAGGLALLSGIATMLVGHTGMTVWIWWGIGAAVVVLAAGGSVLRLGFASLSRLLTEPSGADDEIAGIVTRVRTVILFAIALVTSAVIVMVLKPTL